MSTPISYSKGGRTVQVNYCKGEISGLREFESLGCIVQVRAGPWAERDILRKTAEFFTYAIDVGAKIYIGGGTYDRTIGDRLNDKERAHVEQVYIIHSRDPRFDRFVAAQVERRLIDTALELGVPLINKCLPFGPNGLNPSAAFEDLMIDVRFMVAAAGFTRFDRQKVEAKRSKLSPANTIIGDVRYIEPEDWVVPEGAKPVRLVRRDLQAEGYLIGDRRLYVAPGADWCSNTKSGLSRDNRRRREAARLVRPTRHD
jgi:hypothetical protein